MQAVVSQCAPGEFEPQSAMLVSCGILAGSYPEEFVALVRALDGHIPLIGLVDCEADRRMAVTLLSDWGISPDVIQFVCLPARTPWIRDYGPTFVRLATGQVVLLDPEYHIAALRDEDATPVGLAHLLRLPYAQVPVLLEGGNLIGNGRGLAVTTTHLMRRNAPRGLTQQEMGRILHEFYGLRQWTVLHPLTTELTGHVDMFVTFTAPDTVLVGAYDPRIDPINAEVLDDNAAILAQVRTATGPLRVERIPMPTNHGSTFRTYTNVVYANGVVLMPTYPDADRRAEALARQTYERLLPGWRVEPIHVPELTKQQGALRCATLNVPWLEERFAASLIRDRSEIMQLA